MRLLAYLWARLTGQYLCVQLKHKTDGSVVTLSVVYPDDYDRVKVRECIARLTADGYEELV